MKYTLRPVYRTDYTFLYNLLSERDERENISHQSMPSYEEHCRFWERVPYKDDYIILLNDAPIGMVYLTHQDEVGIHFIKDKWSNDIVKKVIDDLLVKHKGQTLYFNTSPLNKSLLRLLKKMNCKLIQHTYEYQVIS